MIQSGPRRHSFSPGVAPHVLLAEACQQHEQSACTSAHTVLLCNTTHSVDLPSSLVCPAVGWPRLPTDARRILGECQHACRLPAKDGS